MFCVRTRIVYVRRFICSWGLLHGYVPSIITADRQTHTKATYCVCLWHRVTSVCYINHCQLYLIFLYATRKYTSIFFPSRSVITYKYIVSVNNTTLYFIYNKNSILSGRHVSIVIRPFSGPNKGRNMSPLKYTIFIMYRIQCCVIDWHVVFIYLHLFPSYLLQTPNLTLIK